MRSLIGYLLLDLKFLKSNYDDVSIDLILYYTLSINYSFLIEKMKQTLKLYTILSNNHFINLVIASIKINRIK